MTGAADARDRSSLLDAARDSLRAASRRPALALYLLALVGLGWKWLCPLTSLYERAIWSDVLIAAAAVAWIWERARAGSFPRLRAFHLALALYVAATLVSALFAESRGVAARDLLIVTELVVLAVLTSEFASDRDGRDAIILAVTAVALLSFLLAIAGLALFYAGVDTSLVGAEAYGEQFIPSDRYVRVTAGFDLAPLLASFCVFASAIVAQDHSPLPRWLRVTTQVALALLVILTLSRAILAFFVAVAIRAAFTGERFSPARARALVAATVLSVIALMAALSLGRLHLDPTRPETITYEVPDPGNRRETFVAAAETVGDHPLVGKGPGSLVSENRGEPFRAHFTPLNVAATTGIPALAALILLIGVLWRERRRPTVIATWSGLAGLGIDALAQDIEHFRHVWVLLGLADAQRGEPGSRESAELSPAASEAPAPRA